MAVADLLLAHELTAGTEATDLLIPEIVRYELDWLLKMQDEKSGGVYHKVSCKNFDAFDEMPEDEHEPLYLCPISLSATADFAAVIALCSRFYPDRKGELLDAAKRAWDWCQAHPDMPPFVNPPDITTGPYGNKFAIDEFCENGRFWAACELFVATGAEQYHDYIKKSELYAGLGWGDMGGYGLFAYLRHASGWSSPEQTERMKERLHNDCAEIMERYHNDQFGVSLGEDYRWGSNMQVGNHAQMLLMGSLVFPEEAEVYRAAAMTHFHYLLGHNSLSRSFVTGFGANAAKHPHHRPSIAKGEAVPGMVVGGPIRYTTHDKALAGACEGLPPAKCYVDHAESYSSNEVTIYWNSPVYFMMAALGL
jgi:endoglucanase